MIKTSKLLCWLTTAAGLTLLIAGCGGDDDDSSTPDDNSASTAQGVFKDANITGIQYSSGAQSGITEDGRFTYEIGEPVTFFIGGGVTIGTAAGAETVTPLDMVSDGDSSTNEVRNLVRFLLMLDSDEDPSNGITVSQGVQDIAQNWSQVDFLSDDLEAELIGIRADVASVDARTAELPDASAAQSHMESTLRCIYAGGYNGTFSGDDSGTFGFIVDASDGSVSGVAYSNSADDLITLSSTSGLTYGQQPSFASGIASGGGSFSGSFASPNSVSGNWQNDVESESGTFNGQRIGGDQDARHRFTGSFSGDDSGLFTFDINDAGSITGLAYSVVFDELHTLNGTLTGTDLDVTAENGTAVTASLDTATGTITSAEWEAFDGSGDTGTFSGSGCRLN